MRSTSASQSRQVRRRGLDAEVGQHGVVHPLGLELERHLVDRVHVAAPTPPSSTGRFANSAIFSRMSRPSGSSQRHMTMSGWMPIRRSSCTECWVGLVFSSPACPRNGHQREVDEHAAVAARASEWNWRSASRKGSDSMSPTVPPISVITMSTSADSATRRMRFLISSVMCGITWTVPPR